MEKIEKSMLLISCLMTFLCIFVIIGLNVALPTVGEEFKMNNIVQNWALTIFSLSIAAFTIPVAQICGKFGCRKVFIIGTSIFVIGLIMSCFVNSAELFLASRALQGLGFAIYTVSIMSLLMLVVNEKHRGKSLGIYMFVNYLGYITAPAITGFLISNFGWRVIFYIGIVTIILTVLLFTVLVKGEWKSDDVEKLDYLGGFLSIVGLFAFTYGFSDILSFTGQISIIIGIIVLIIFGLYELKIKDPVFNMRLFKNKTFLAYNIAGFLFFFACYIYDVLFNYQLQYVNGFNPQYAGMLLIIFPLFMALSTPIAGRLSDKIHPQKFATVGLVLLICALLFIFTFFGMNTSIYVVAVAMILLAVSVGVFSVPNVNAIMGTVSQDDIPHATAAEITLRSTGQTMSYALLTLVFTMVVGNLALSTQNAGMVVLSTKTICIISIVLTVVAILFSIWGIKSESSSNV